MSIWKYKEIKKSISNASEFLTLEEGDTPVVRFDENKNKILLKREDLNPTGSWKDRGVAYRITELISLGISEAVLASSGNAAISYLTYANLVKDFKLHIVVSPSINEEKRRLIEELINKGSHKLYIDAKAKNKSVEISLTNKITLLKTSTEESILKGYWSLGFEIYDEIKKHLNENILIFCPASSGTALVGFVQGLFLRIEDETKMPKIIACQTQSCNPLVRLKYENILVSDEKSFADAIVDKSMLRSGQIINIINRTNGDALSISNSDLIEAQKFLLSKGVNNLSFTSLLSVAGYLKKRDNTKDSINICIASGR